MSAEPEVSNAISQRAAGSPKRQPKRKKQPQQPKLKRGRGASKPFPAATFESVLPLAKTIFDHAGASREMRRLTVFDKLKRGSESGASRMLVINSARYGLTVGGRESEHLKLTDTAVKVLDPGVLTAESTQAKFNLAIEGIPPFLALYEKFRNGRLPASEVMKDALAGFHLDADDQQECVDLFVENAKYVGLLRVMSGAERLLSIEHVIEELPSQRRDPEFLVASRERSETVSGGETDATDYESVCFLVAPIGDEGSVERKHSDMVLSSLVERAVEPLKLRVVRSDKITTPGMISRQIVDYILHSKLVIVDLSFHNPNVFYELALRHVIGRPIVHLIRRTDRIPFDIGNFRTIQIDDDKYDLIAKLDTYRAEIANQARHVLQETDSTDNPILAFCPGLQVTVPNGNN